MRIRTDSVRLYVPLFLCLFLSVPAVFGQQPAAEQPKVEIKAGVEEVVLDIVVRDKKGKELLDLEPADVTVTDNGAKREIKSMRLVEGREAIEKGAKVQLDPLRQIRLVSLVFTPLGVEDSRLARQAALDLVKGDQGQNVFYAVMMLNEQLNVLQEFTTDRAKLKKAVENATSGGQMLRYAQQSAAIRTQLQNQLGGGAGSLAAQAASAAQQPNPTASGPQAAAGAGAIGGAVAQAKMVEVLMNMLRNTESIAAEETGRGQIMSLLNIARSQAVLPGRKSVLYFSTGLYVAPQLEQEWQSVFSTANRANVTFYAIDARGLQTGGGSASSSESGGAMGENAGAMGELAAAAKESATTMTRTEGAVSVAEVRAGERGENSMRSNTQQALRVLSESTGGFLISNTNDFRSPLRKINEEINTYYELTYNPGIENYDASFRKIRVDVNRPEAKVQARSGYFALPPEATAGGISVLPYEMPLLAALQANPLPKDVEYRAAALHLDPAKSGEGRGILVVELPMRNVTFTVDSAKSTYKAHVSLVALLKDASGNVVRKWNRDLPLQGATDKLEAVKAGNFFYKEQFTAAPGRYTLETAVMDRETSKIGGRKAVYVVTANPRGVALSNIALVRRFDANAQGLDPAEPFQFQGGRITPTLASGITGGKGVMLAMFFTVYPDASITDKPAITIEYLKDGQVIGKGEIPLPPADSLGRIPYVMSSSAENMPPGDYEIHAVAKQGDTTAEERVFIKVE